MGHDSETAADNDSRDALGTRSENVYETIFRAIDDAVFLVDVERRDDRAGGEYRFTFRRNNASHREQTGLSEDELRGQTPQELLGDDQGTAVTENYRRCVERGEPIEYEETLSFDAGTTSWETKLTPILEDGEVTGIVGTSRNVTERNEQERTLNRMHRRFEAILETMSAAVFLKDTDGRFLLMNRACRDLFGIDADADVSGLTDEDLFPEDRIAASREQDQRVLETGEPIETEETVPTAAGETVRLTRKSPVYGDDGTVEAVCAVSTDITERKRRRERLQRQSSLLEAVTEATKDGTLVTDLDWNVLHYNDRFLELWDLADRDEVPSDGKALLADAVDVLEQPEPEQFTATVERLYDRPDDVHDSELQFTDGRVLEFYSTPVVDADRRYGRLWVYRDVSARTEYEGAIQRAHEELRQIVDLIPDLIFAKDQDGEYLLANEATADAYGTTPADVEGSKESEIIPSIEDSEQFRSDDLEVIESGERKEIPEEQLTTADGETKTFDTVKIPYELSGSGNDAVLGYARDVTERKEYERTLERQRDDLELLNQVVRHDVRNELQVVLAYTELLLERVDDENGEAVEQVLEAARSAVDITETARDVTEVLLQVGVDRSPVRLRSVLRSQVDDIRSNHERALLTVDGPLPDVTVLADELLESVFRNLLANAIVHNDEDVPEVTVSAHADENVVCVRIEDNGPGIPADQKADIFREGEKGLDSDGTGLGLYLVETLVDRYEGDVWIEDNEPVGSVVVVELPLVG
ncbi:PAS domain-containing sensor histidine kinase [Halobiforma nitratireducens]|uniref:histidine kinase n=1 Tax=Halobiforma nitratireducens JCM 10879 TaxID=1227454 RepID=M0LFQ7_9EURY|nr:PAS domain-containing protein [Halobiforma nitratireducens]EMA32417.1 signal-transducing histidine kinase [Halobiforma nitratireducens JCM 10879]